MSAARFVAYYRVSIDKQSRSGLGLEAQRVAVEAHVAGARGAVGFIEIESGRKNDRPQLAVELAAARATRAVASASVARRVSAICGQQT